MTALEKLKAELGELKAAFQAFILPATAPKAEGEAAPASAEAAEGTPAPEAKTEAPGAITAELKAEIEGHVAKVSGFEATIETALAEANTAKLDFEAKTKEVADSLASKSAELEKEFESKVSKEAAKIVAEAGGKPLAKANDEPAAGKVSQTVDAVTGIDRVKAALEKRKAA